MKYTFLYLLVISCILFNSCHDGSSQSSEGPDGDTLRVMTYNIHHANPPSTAADSIIDLQAIADVINKAKPDLVALQEVDVNNDRAGKELDEAAALAKLTGMHYHFTRAIYYRGGKYGDAVLSRFPIEDTLNYHLPVIKGTNEETRSVCMIKVNLPGNKTILFASTHLGLSKETRLLQARKLFDIIHKLSNPLILAGDMNATPESKAIQLLDSIMTRSCTENCAFSFSATNPGHKIDYIMYRPADKFKPLKQKVIHETYASDHMPVIVDFKVL